jgi:hypothetical protein
MSSILQHAFMRVHMVNRLPMFAPLQSKVTPTNTATRCCIASCRQQLWCLTMQSLNPLLLGIHNHADSDALLSLVALSTTNNPRLPEVGPFVPHLACACHYAQHDVRSLVTRG